MPHRIEPPVRIRPNGVGHPSGVRWTRLCKLILIAAFPPLSFAQAPEILSVAQATEDISSMCRFVEREYAYFDRRKTDWKRACAAYRAEAVAPLTRDAFVTLLERLLGELYDHHAHLGTNTRRSPRLVPSQTALVAEWKDGQAILVAVRRDSAAERAGLRPGMRVLTVDGEDVGSAVDRVAPGYLSVPDPAARTWALQVVLAGRHENPSIKLRVQDGTTSREVEFVASFPAPSALLTHGRAGDVGFIRIANALGDPALVEAFDRALADLAGVRALVLDLRDTGSGGISSVARGIMGHFVATTKPYQRHELVAEYRDSGIRRMWVEEVAPRAPLFKPPVVVLVGRWTGSMGEGIAIGLHAARGAPVLGEPMAKLQGALGEIELPNSKIVVRVPTERLAHVDGTPREAFVPRPVPGAGAPGRDSALDAAVAVAAKLGAAKAR